MRSHKTTAGCTSAALQTLKAINGNLLIWTPLKCPLRINNNESGFYKTWNAPFLGAFHFGDPHAPSV